LLSYVVSRSVTTCFDPLYLCVNMMYTLEEKEAVAEVLKRVRAECGFRGAWDSAKWEVGSFFLAREATKRIGKKVRWDFAHQVIYEMRSFKSCDEP
jgi:hypothetical protein